VGLREVGGDVRYDFVLVRQGVERDDSRSQEGGQVEGAVVDRQLIGARPGAEEKLLDQAAKRARALRDCPDRGAGPP